MNNLKRFEIIILVVILAISLTMIFVACNDDTELGNDITITNAGAELTQGKTYRANVALAGADLTFVDFDKQHYAVDVIDANTLESVRTLTDFEITKVSDTEITLVFTDTDYILDNNYWRLSSTSAVVSDGTNLECSIYLESVSYGITADVYEINRYDDDVTITLSLTSGTLVNPLSKEMIVVDGALREKEYTLTRSNDTTFTMAFQNAFKDNVTCPESAEITLLSNAIIGNMPESLTVDFSIIAPVAMIDTESMKFISLQDETLVVVPLIVDDNLIKTITKTDVSIPKPEDIDEGDWTAFNVQNVDFVEENVVLITLSTTLAKDAAISELEAAALQIKATAVNMSEDPAIISFGTLRNAISIRAEADLSSGAFDGYILSISAVNGVFKNPDAITKADISIKDKNNNNIDNFTITSKSEKMVVVKVSSAATTCAGVVTIANSLMDNRFGLSATDLTGVFQGSYVEDYRVIADLAISLLKTALPEIVSAAASTVGSNIGERLTPRILDFLGISRAPTLDEIHNSVEAVGKKVENLSSQLKNSTDTIMNAIEKTQYGVIFQDFNAFYEEVTYYVFETYAEVNGLAKLLQMENAKADANGNISDDDLAALNSNGDYVAAKNAFIVEYEKYGVLFPTRIHTFGQNLMGKSFGEKDGYLYALWGLLRTKNIWDIQTIDVKEDFMKSACGVYTLAMAATTRYLEYKNSGNKARYVDSFDKVMKTISTYEKDLDASISRRAAGKTLEYTTSKVVSLTLDVYDPQNISDQRNSKFASSLTRTPIYPSTLTQSDMEKIVNAAKAKGIDFFKSMRDAKFVNLPKEDSIDVPGETVTSRETTYKYVVAGRGKSYNSRKVINGTITTYTIKYYTVSGNSVSKESTRVNAVETATKDPEMRLLQYKNKSNKYYRFK